MYVSQTSLGVYPKNVMRESGLIEEQLENESYKTSYYKHDMTLSRLKRLWIRIIIIALPFKEMKRIKSLLF